MRFSAFTGFGFLSFSGKVPRGEAIYRALVAADGGNFADEFDSPMGGTRYARAMAIARARATLERVENNSHPLLAQESLPVFAAMFGIGMGGSPSSVRAEVAARMRIPLGPGQENIEAALELLIDGHAGPGSFVEFRTMPLDEAEEYPSDAINSGPGTFKPATSRRKTIRFTEPVTVSTVEYEDFSGDPSPPEVGEEWVIDAGRPGLQERVTILAVGNGTITANFQRAHDRYSFATASPFPYWMSTKQHSLVLVAPGLGADPSLRNKIVSVLDKMLSGPSTYDIVEMDPAEPTEPRVFKVGEPSIGIALIAPTMS
jgi:hypothetical protein